MRVWSAILAAALVGQAQAQEGRAIVASSLQRHAPPAEVVEELALIVTDRAGRYTVRGLRHEERQGRHVMVVETPADMRGTTIRLDDGVADGEGRAHPLLGSDFRLGDFAPEVLEANDYRRRADVTLNRQPHYVVDAFTRESQASSRRLFLRKDNLFLARIDHLDAEGRTVRRQSFRDPRPDGSGAWRPGMILMEDLREGRRSLLKVERREQGPDSLHGGLAAHSQ